MIVYILFLSVFFLDYLATSIGIIPRVFTWLPEILSGIVAIQVALYLTRKRNISISFGYLVILIILALLIVAGIIANSVQPGAVFAGIRGYLKYIPFFFLPLVMPVSNVMLMTQLKFIMMLVIFQVPLTLFQRFVQYAGVRTGDSVVGTLGIPSALTIISLSAMAIILSAYYKKFITVRRLIVMIGLLLIPPTVNETTITLFLLPLTFILPTIIFARNSQNKKQIYSIIIAGSLAMVVFAGVYDSMYGDRWGGSITNILSDDDELTSFLLKEELSEESDARIKGDVGRFDSINLALDYLSHYPTKLIMGVGIGNAMNSFSEKLLGEYRLQYIIKGGGTTALSHLIWEVGVLGVVLIITLFIFISLDAYALVNRDDIYGILALGWCAVMCFIFVSLVYKTLIFHNAISYLFWYFSGCIVAERYRSRPKNTYKYNNTPNKFDKVGG